MPKKDLKVQPTSESGNTAKLPVIGRWALLLQKPDGCTSSAYDVIVGKKYKVVDMEGSNVWLSTKDGFVSIWRGRVEIL